ncbi:MAG: HupE/UreJ family protein [Gammaproteobacteria bacterium]|nr:HupE/UreJ family protein [Gammaproteobacteria bacterium]
MIRYSFIVFFFFLNIAYADEIRPSFLELTQQTDTSYQVLWKKASQGEAKNTFILEPVFPLDSQLIGIKKRLLLGNATIETYLIKDDQALIDKPITIKGLELTSSDVLVRIHYLDDETEFIRVLPESPHFTLTHKSGFYNMASTYLILGIEHILEGFDHLFFVLALLLLVANIKRLIGTITAFTVAHTITLILASLDIIHLSSRAVEATIALSIVFVCAEVVYAKRGQIHLSQQFPWLIAFGFGLIHGLGFSEALKEIGLPQNEVVPSLIFFNIGVEIGQLLFVSFMLLIFWVIKKLFTRDIVKHIEIIVTYMIGSIAVFWLIERIY